MADQARSLESTLCPHPRTGRIARHHLHEASIQRQFKLAVRKAAIPKPATSHCLRQLHCHRGTTMIYLHVMQRPGAGGPSPLDIP
ncbi:MAG: hypothetical protein NTW21_05865 [Verrucomicrobia bacterium]|nr:hypothetical protein [Verrucomicrobiota bacterium]